MTEIAVRNLSVSIEQNLIVRDVSCTLGAGQVIGIIGPNGAGKTTFLKALCRLIPSDRGTISINGKSLPDLTTTELARTIAYLPQRHVLHWDMTLEQTVSLGRLPHVAGMDRLGDQDRHAIGQAMQAAEVTGLASRKVGSLSGGELARGMLARALAVEAPFLFADEPIAALDPYHALHIMGLLRGLAQAGRSVLVVMHDLTLALRFCDRLLLLAGGQLVGDGVPAEVLDPAQLEAVYRVSGVYGNRDGEPYLVPWQRLSSGTFGA
jgi:iron complex transport system ATP-binding protein